MSLHGYSALAQTSRCSSDVRTAVADINLEQCRIDLWGDAMVSMDCNSRMSLRLPLYFADMVADMNQRFEAGDASSSARGVFRCNSKEHT